MVDDLARIFVSFGDSIFTDVTVDSVLSFKKKWNSIRDILEERPFSISKLQTHMTQYLGMMLPLHGITRRISIRERDSLNRKINTPLEKISEVKDVKEYQPPTIMRRGTFFNRSSSGEKSEKKKNENQSGFADSENPGFSSRYKAEVSHETTNYNWDKTWDRNDKIEETFLYPKYSRRESIRHSPASVKITAHDILDLENKPKHFSNLLSVMSETIVPTFNNRLILDMSFDYLELFKRNSDTIRAVENSSFEIDSPRDGKTESIVNKLLREKLPGAFLEEPKKELLKKTSVYIGSHQNLNPEEIQRKFEEAYLNRHDKGKSKWCLS